MNKGFKFLIGYICATVIAYIAGYFIEPWKADTGEGLIEAMVSGITAPVFVINGASYTQTLYMNKVWSPVSPRPAGSTLDRQEAHSRATAIGFSLAAIQCLFFWLPWIIWSNSNLERDKN